MEAGTRITRCVFPQGSSWHLQGDIAAWCFERYLLGSAMRITILSHLSRLFFSADSAQEIRPPRLDVRDRRAYHFASSETTLFHTFRSLQPSRL